MPDGVCVVCRRRDPARGSTCDPCLKAVRALLDDLPRKLRRLPLMLMPGQAPGGERVSTSRTGSPTGANLDALNLVGPGSIPLPGPLHPKMRRWTTTRVVEVTAKVGAAGTATHNTTLTDFHSEPETDPDTGQPVMVADDDQTGIMPPAPWLDLWARRWRSALGHHRPPEIRIRRRGAPPVTPKMLSWAVQHTSPDVVKRLVLARTVGGVYRQGAADLIAGKEPGFVGRRPQALREDDPVADHWEIRFGDPTEGAGAAANITYLATWLNMASETGDVDLAAFASELRALSAELARVIGEKTDQQYLGKCPAEILDRTSGDQHRCAASLWQDPHASIVECPRCHSTWGPRPIHLVHLSAEIRRVTPLDRRRRYNAEEIDALWGDLPPAPGDDPAAPRCLRCPDCTGELQVQWQEVTGSEDRCRWWQPIRTTCRNACAGQDIL